MAQHQEEAELHPGDHVSWRLGVGEAIGQVVEKITEDKKVGSRTFHASPDDPRYLVKSETSGKEAIRKPESLHKLTQAEEEEARERHAHHTKEHHQTTHSSNPSHPHGRRTTHHQPPSTHEKGSHESKGKGGDESIMKEADLDSPNDPTYEPNIRQEEALQATKAREDDAAFESLPSDDKLLQELQKEEGPQVMQQ